MTNLQQLRVYAISHSLFHPLTLKAVIQRMGFVQADPIRSPARAQVAARFKAVVLLPSPALALVTRSEINGPRLSANPSRLARRIIGADQRPEITES